MKKYALFYIILLLSGVSYSTVLTGEMRPSKPTNITLTTKSKRTYKSCQYRLGKKSKIVLTTVIGCFVSIVIVWVVKFLVKRRANGRGSNDDHDSPSEEPATAEAFKAALVKVMGDSSVANDFDVLQSIRQRVSEDILNHTSIEGYPNALEYVLQTMRGLTMRTSVLNVLIDRDNQSTSKIYVTDVAFVGIISRVVDAIKLGNAYAGLDLLKSILPKINLDLLNKKLFGDFMSTGLIFNGIPSELVAGYHFTVLEFIVACCGLQQDFLHVVDILLSEEVYVKAQLTTSEGLKSAIRLAIINTDYERYLSQVVQETPESVLNSKVFAFSNLDLVIVNDEGDALIELITRKLATFTHISENEKRTYKLVLNSLLENDNISVAISALSMKNLLDMIKEHEDLSDQGLEWLRILRKRATKSILNEVLVYAINNMDQESEIFNILLNHEANNHVAEMDEQVLASITALENSSANETLWNKIFEKIEFTPDLLTQNIGTENVVDHLTEGLEHYRDPHKRILNLLLSKESYKNELLPNTAKGLKLAVLLVRNHQSYLPDLQRIINETDPSILHEPLFGSDHRQNTFDYIVKEKNREVLTYILSKDIYRQQLFTQDVAGFKRAVEVGAMIDEYHNELKTIYEADPSLLTQKVFNNNQKNALDYANQQESRILIDFFLTNKSYEKPNGDATITAEDFKQALELANTDQKHLSALDEMCSNKDVSSFLEQRLFNTDRYYRLDTNEAIDESNLDDEDNANVVQGQTALDYVIGRGSMEIIKVLLAVDGYKEKVFDPNKIVTLQRLISLINLNEEYIGELRIIQSKLKQEVLHAHKIQGTTALECVIYKLENTGEQSYIDRWKQVIDIFLEAEDEHDRDSQFHIFKALRGAVDFLERAYLLKKKTAASEVLKKICLKIDKLMLNFSCFGEGQNKSLLRHATEEGALSIVTVLFDDEAIREKLKITKRIFKLAVKNAVRSRREEQETRIAILEKIASHVDPRYWQEKMFANGDKNALEYATRAPRVRAILARLVPS